MQQEHKTPAAFAFLLWVVCYMSSFLRIEISFLSCYQSLDDGIGEAILLHSVQALDGTAAWSGNLVDGSLWVLACSLKQLYGSLHGLEQNGFTNAVIKGLIAGKK